VDQNLLGELMKQAPALGAFAALMAVALRWLERQHERCHDQHKAMAERYEEQTQQRHEESLRTHELLGEVGKALDRCADLHERALRGN
jgi:hypothetical protein